MNLTSLKTAVPLTYKHRLVRLTRLPAMLNASQRFLPDFLIIGAQKCGTTSLFQWMSQHPQIVKPFAKELHFFDKYYWGSTWYRACFPTKRAARKCTPVDLPQVAGEASPSYMFHPHAAARAANLLPHAKCIAILRNPVDRAFSHYQHEKRFKREMLSFEDAIEMEPQRLGAELERMKNRNGYQSSAVQHFSYLRRGQYAEQLAEWSNRFGEKQLKVIISEEIFAKPADTLAAVFDFIGVNPDSTINPAAANTANYTNMRPETRRHLESYFKPYNQRLSQMLGRPLPW